MKHLPMATANAIAATVAVAYIVCAVSVLLFPDLAMTVARSWFHEIDISTTTLSTQTNPSSLVLGFIAATVSGWILGYVFAGFYNMFAKK